MTAKGTKLPLLTALCCMCGQIRTSTTTGGHLDVVDVSYWRHLRESTIPQLRDITPYRMTVRRACSHCKITTTHALIREDDDRNEAEIADHLEALPAQLEVHEILTELRARGDVKIRHVDRDAVSQRLGVAVTYYLYENQWMVSIYGSMPIEDLLVRLREIQQRIAAPGGRTWFPRAESRRDKPDVSVWLVYTDSCYRGDESS